MPFNDDLPHVEHVMECMDRVQGYTECGREAFFKDIQEQDAVLRNLQILAESSQRLSHALKAAHPDVN